MVQGKKRHYIAACPEGMTDLAAIADTDLWVGANQAAVSVRKLVEKLLVALGYQVGGWAVRTE